VPNNWYLSDNVYGPGDNDKTGQCYAAAVQQGHAIVSAGKSIYTIGIINDAGYELPETGGEGTRMIYLLGITLMVLAGAGLILVRRRKERAA